MRAAARVTSRAALQARGWRTTARSCPPQGSGHQCSSAALAVTPLWTPALAPHACASDLRKSGCWTQLACVARVEVVQQGRTAAALWCLATSLAQLLEIHCSFLSTADKQTCERVRSASRSACAVCPVSPFHSRIVSVRQNSPFHAALLSPRCPRMCRIHAPEAFIRAPSGTGEKCHTLAQLCAACSASAAASAGPALLLVPFQCD